MGSKKDVNKSLRLEQCDVDYIMSFGGEDESFSVCFHKMLTLFRDKEQALKKRIEQFSQEVAAINKDIASVEKKLNKLDSMTYDLFSLDRYVKTIRDELSSIQQKDTS